VSALQWILSAALVLIVSIKMIFDRNLIFADPRRAQLENNSNRGAAIRPIKRP
jgi:hypothetical protein